jgi:tetratricopeptide (TPR) repeat protein
MAVLAKLIFFAGMAFPLSAQTIPSQAASYAQAAQDAERRNDFPAAVHEYRELASLLPANAEVQSNLGVALYFNHDFQPAIAAFRKAIALNPNLMAPHLFAGLAWYQLSNPDAAVPDLENAVRINHSDAIAHTWLGYAYGAQSRNDLAVKEFRAASQLDPSNIDVWYALGHTWLQIGKDATVKLLAVAPDGGRVWELAGEQSQLRGDHKSALDDFEQANARRPDIPELRASMSGMGGVARPAPAAQSRRNSEEDDLYEQAHNAERNSRAAFEHVVQLAPDSYRAHQIMADAFITEKQDDKAIDEYRIVLRLKPDLPGVHEELGEALLRSGKPSDALNEFEAELQVQPYSASAHMNAGRALLMLGQDEAAGKMLDSAARLNRPPLETYVLLGKLDVTRRDYRGAINVLTRYTSSEKGNSTAYFLLAMAYRGVGDRKQMNSAIDSYKKTSQDAKERSLAQRQLKPADDEAEIASDIGAAPQ